MKKKIRIFMVMTIVLSIFFTGKYTYAMSKENYWANRYPGEILPIEKYEGIEVLEGNIVMDFTKDPDFKAKDFTIGALVTGQYKIANKSNQDRTIGIALPYLAYMESFSLEKISFRANEEEPPLKIHIGENFDQNHLWPIRNAIRNKDYLPRNLDLDKKGILYSFSLESETNRDLYIGLSLESKGRGKAIITGFHGIDMGEVPIYQAQLEDGGRLDLFLPEEGMGYDLQVYSDKNHQRPSKDYNLDIEKKEMTIGDYINFKVDELAGKLDYFDYLDRKQIFNLLVRNLDKDYEHYDDAIFFDGLASDETVIKDFLLIYQLDLKAGEVKEVEVNYETRGIQGYRETLDPVYYFDYNLGPGKEWDKFGDFTLEINLPEKYPYLIKENLPLEDQGKGVYIGRFDGLPQDKLEFGLYSKNKISKLDRMAKFTKDNLAIIIPILYLVFFTIPRKLISKLAEKRDSFYK